MGWEVFWRESAPVEGHAFAGGCYGGKGGFAVMRAPSPLSFFFEVSGFVYVTVRSSSVRVRGGVLGSSFVIGFRGVRLETQGFRRQPYHSESGEVGFCVFGAIFPFVSGDLVNEHLPLPLGVKAFLGVFCSLPGSESMAAAENPESPRAPDGHASGMLSFHGDSHLDPRENTHQEESNSTPLPPAPQARGAAGAGTFQLKIHGC